MEMRLSSVKSRWDFPSRKKAWKALFNTNKKGTRPSNMYAVNFHRALPTCTYYFPRACMPPAFFMAIHPDLLYLPSPTLSLKHKPLSNHTSHSFQLPTSNTLSRLTFLVTTVAPPPGTRNQHLTAGRYHHEDYIVHWNTTFAPTLPYFVSSFTLFRSLYPLV